MAPSPTQADDVPLCGGGDTDKETHVDAAAAAAAAAADLDAAQTNEADEVDAGAHAGDTPPQDAPPQQIDASDAPPAPANNDDSATAPPLPDEAPPLPNEEPPLPDEPVPETQSGSSKSACGGDGGDDGWDPVWSDAHQAWYFVNRFTNQTQWENPRVPDAAAAAPGTDSGSVAGGYNPAIHGDYDPDAWYAKGSGGSGGADATAVAAVATGWAVPGIMAGGGGSGNGVVLDGSGSDRTEDEEAAFAAAAAQAAAVIQSSLAAVDTTNSSSGPEGWWAAANGYAEMAGGGGGGASLKAERSGKKPTRAELKAFKEKRRVRKEEKRRAWLRD